MRTRISISTSAVVLATPAFAGEEGPFFSLNNAELIVAVGFLVFVGFVLYKGVHKFAGKKLDERAEGIKSDIAEARSLREEAQTILASFERKHKEVAGHVEGIIAHAKAEATLAAEAAKSDLADSIVRRLHAAEDQIKSAEQAAVHEIRDKAVEISVAAAKDVISAKMTAKQAVTLLDEAIAEVGAKLH